MLSPNHVNEDHVQWKDQSQSGSSNFSVDDLSLPICNDAWSLLDEFEDVPDINMMDLTALSNCPTSISNNSADQLMVDVKMTFPDTVKLDVMQPSPLGESLSATFTESSCKVNDTCDVLGDLICDTILNGAALDGLLSNTMLDLSVDLEYLLDNDLDYNDSNEGVVQAVLGKKEINVASVDTDDKVESVKDLKYMNMRQKNNEASKRSRFIRKRKHQDMLQEAARLENDNERLRKKVATLEKTVGVLKSSLMKHIIELKTK